MVKTPIYLKNLSPEEKIHFKNKYDYIFFDKDDTIELLNGSVIPGAAEALRGIATHDKKIHLFTDSCLATKEVLANTFGARYPEFKKENIITTTLVLIHYLKRIGFKKKIYAIGSEDGLVKELADAGFEVLSDTEIKKYDSVRQLAMSIRYDKDVGAVVVGADMNFSYMKLLKAVNYLRDKSVLLFTTQTTLVACLDPILPVSAALCTPITAITNREPICSGKSSEASVDFIKSLGYDLKKCLFVGDFPGTDIKIGNMCGMDTLLVLCGTTNKERLQAFIDQGDELVIPTYVTDSTADLRAFFS
uniref:4-nitrophenylphosphatase n=1 Tax=Riptortus pedestris TaxID=329032 RepID=R4WE63_RIPPE|nr:4-nitrophenylphosphatase [Riptortus pedestris]